MNKKLYKKQEQGLKGGPNYQVSEMFGAVTSTGYWPDSPDRNNDFNIIPSNEITMEGMDMDLIGQDDQGNIQYMTPGNNYTFPGNYVTETPVAKQGGIFLGNYTFKNGGLVKMDNGGPLPKAQVGSPYEIQPIPYRAPNIVRQEGREYYDPMTETIYLQPSYPNYAYEQAVKNHEKAHHQQKLKGKLSTTELWPGPLKEPAIGSTDDMIFPYYNRTTEDAYGLMNAVPKSTLFGIPEDIAVIGFQNKTYDTPGTAEYEAEQMIHKKKKGGSIYGLPKAHDISVPNLSRQEGGDMPFGLPLKEQNIYTLPEYNQPRNPMTGEILPDPQRPNLGMDTGATEYKYTYGFDDGDVDVPSIVAGQYIGDQALDRYRLTGERFKTMADPGSYSKFYNMVNDLGIMQEQKHGGSVKKVKIKSLPKNWKSQ